MISMFVDVRLEDTHVDHHSYLSETLLLRPIRRMEASKVENNWHSSGEWRLPEEEVAYFLEGQ